MKLKWVAVFDFDGTCIPLKPYKSLYDAIDSNNGITQKCHESAKRMRRHYFSKLHSRFLTQKEEKKWFKDTIELYVKSRTDMKKVREILRQVKLRNGVKECFEELKSCEVPIAIISYGVRQFIEISLELNGVRHLVDEIYAAKLRLNRRGVIIGLDDSTMITPSDKKGASISFADRCGVPHKNILGVGDSKNDACLGTERKNRIGIAENKERTFELAIGMGTVVISQDFRPITEWFRSRLGEILAPETEIPPCCNPLCGKDGQICRDCGNFMPRSPKLED